MNDFLQHLVRRAQGRVPLLERRRPSLFESRQSAATGMPEVVEIQSAAPHTPQPAPPMATAAAPTPSAHAQAVAPPTASVVTAPAPTLVTPVRVATPAPVAGAPASNAAPIKTISDAAIPASVARTVQMLTTPPRAHSGRLPPKPAAPVQAALRHGRSEPLPSPARAQAANHQGAVEPVQAASRTTVIERQAVANKSTIASPAQPPRLPTPSRIASRQGAAVQVAHPARRAAPVAAPTPPPAPVQVSIGRVEIRSSTGPSPPANTPARLGAPALGLDEYLRQRHGDRR